MHGHDYLIDRVLRKEMGFPGFIISDWQAIDQLPGDYESDVEIAINAGIDMSMCPQEYEKFQTTLTNNVNNGKVTEARIDEATSRILTAKFELGLFEHPYANTTHLGTIGSEAHREVAREAVRQSLVLLKNSNAILPLDTSSINKIIVAGSNADNIGNQCGGWTISWQGSSGAITPGTTILDGIKAEAEKHNIVVENKGTRAKGKLNGDVAILIVGEKPYAEGQGDSNDLSLDQTDTQLVTDVCKAMPCIVILVSGRPMTVTDQINQANAFVAGWLPGTEGDGIAEVLFGNTDFSGKLPMTWPDTMDQVATNIGDNPYNCLYSYGYGCDYANGCPANENECVV